MALKGFVFSASLVLAKGPIMLVRKIGPFLFPLLALALAAAQQPKRVDDAALKNARRTGEDWLTYGLTLSETRYSPLKQIDATTVSRLGLAWSYDVGPGGGGQAATPVAW